MYAFMQEMFLGSFSDRFFVVNLIVMHNYIDFARYPAAGYPHPIFRDLGCLCTRGLVQRHTPSRDTGAGAPIVVR